MSLVMRKRGFCITGQLISAFVFATPLLPIRTKGSLVRDLVSAQFVVALSKSYLPTS